MRYDGALWRVVLCVVLCCSGDGVVPVKSEEGSGGAGSFSLATRATKDLITSPPPPTPTPTTRTPYPLPPSSSLSSFSSSSSSSSSIVHSSEHTPPFPGDV